MIGSRFVSAFQHEKCATATVDIIKSTCSKADILLLSLIIHTLAYAQIVLLFSVFSGKFCPSRNSAPPRTFYSLREILQPPKHSENSGNFYSPFPSVIFVPPGNSKEPPTVHQEILYVVAKYSGEYSCNDTLMVTSCDYFLLGVVIYTCFSAPPRSL